MESELQTGFSEYNLTSDGCLMIDANTTRFTCCSPLVFVELCKSGERSQVNGPYSILKEYGLITSG